MTESLASAALHTTELSIDGMHCGGCTGRVQQALAAVPGVVDAAVDLDTHTATVTAQETVGATQLVEAVDAAGYRAAVRDPLLEDATTPHAHPVEASPAPMAAAASTTRHPLPADSTTIELEIDGMTCASCVSRVEKRWRRCRCHARVGQSRDRARHVDAAANVSAAQLVDTVKQAGYGATPT